MAIFICVALRDSVPFVQFKKRENTHGGVLLVVKLQVKSQIQNCVKHYICSLLEWKYTLAGVTKIAYFLTWCVTFAKCKAVDLKSDKHLKNVKYFCFTL